MTLEEAPQADLDLAVWLVDTTRLGGILRVSANGEHVTDIELPLGSTRGSREGDTTCRGSPLVRSFHEPALPAALLRVGANVLEFELAEGGWAAWDAGGSVRADGMRGGSPPRPKKYETDNMCHDARYSRRVRWACTGRRRPRATSSWRA